MNPDPSQVYAEAVKALLPGEFPGSDLDSSSIMWFMFRIAHRAEQKLDYEVHRPLGWSWTGFRIMFNTFVAGTAEPAQLAALIGLSRPTITVALNKLEADGYVIRQRVPGNNRHVEVRLTEAGEDAVRRAIRQQRGAEERFLDSLTAEKRDVLREALHELYLSLEPE